MGFNASDVVPFMHARANLSELAEQVAAGAEDIARPGRKAWLNRRTGSRIKVYSSEKVPAQDGDWRHRRTTLRPDSDRPGFEPTVIELGEGDEGFVVVAEVLMVLRGRVANRQRLEHSLRALEEALAPVRKAAAGGALSRHLCALR